MEQSRLTRIIDQMDERGLVQRKADVDDGRRVRIFLTVKGKRLANALVEEARVHEEGLLQSLAHTDAEHLKPALKALLAHMSG